MNQVWTPLRIFVPALQMLAAVSVLALKFQCHSNRIFVMYLHPATNIVFEKLNLPIVIVIYPFLGVAEKLTTLLPGVGTSLLDSAAKVLVGVVFAAAILLFWYFLVVELELRASGKSIIRYSSGSKELLKVVIFCAIAIISIKRGYNDTRLLLAAEHPVEAIVGGLICLIWAIIFFGFALQDSTIYLRNRPGSPS